MEASSYGRLYLVTDRQGLSEVDFLDTIEKAVQGGVTCVQLREKLASDAVFLALAHQLKKRLQPYQVPLIINDRIDIAVAVGADGVHLGQSDMQVHLARKALGAKAIIGLSAEIAVENVQAAQMLDVDYIAVGPVFQTLTKADAGPVCGLEGLRRLCLASSKLVIAIGGIDHNNLDGVMDQGVAGVAMVSALMQAGDPYVLAQAFRACIEQKLSKRLVL